LDLEHELPPGQTDGDTPSTEDLAGLEAELKQLREQNAMLVDRLARAQAEFENARRRAQREQEDFREFALANAIKSLIPILDSFDRALASGSGGEDLRSGLELVDRQLHDALTKLGVEEFASQGQPFDPTVHDAVEMVETEDVPDQYVLQELQSGYKLKGRLLRPAMVRVARNPRK